MKKNKIRKNFNIFLVFIMFINLINLNISYADTNIDVKAPVNMVRNINKNQVLLNEEFTVNYKFQPQPIPIGDIVPEAYLKDKEIVIVMDTSGSMDWDLQGNDPWWNEDSRMDIAKSAANLFIDKLKNDERVEVSLVSYSDIAEVENFNGNKFLKIFEGNNSNTIKNRINNLTPYGSTNIGDGLRRAYYTLINEGESNARKFIVFLTDGSPTAFSFDDIKTTSPSWWSNGIGIKVVNEREYDVKKIINATYKTDSGKANKYFYNWNSDDYNDYSLNYAKTIAEMIKSNNDIESFFIAFSQGSNTNKLKEISEEANGYYKEAMTDEAINEVYEKLSEQIASDLPIHAIYFQETFPDGLEITDVPNGMEVNGQTITGDIGSIMYNLNEETNQFEAEPFEFSIKLKAKQTGDYTLGKNNSSLISYTDIDGTADTKKYFPESNISVYEQNPPQIQASIKNIAANSNEYTLTITVDESSNIKVYNIRDKELWAGYKNKGTFSITLNKADLVGNYIKIKAVDKFNNSVIENTPVINIISIDLDDDLNINGKIDGTINIQTEPNSTITEIKLNDVIIANDKLTDNGQYSHITDFNIGDNIIDIKAVNEYGNISILSETVFVENVEAPLAEVIVQVTDATGLIEPKLDTEGSDETEVIRQIDPVKLKGDAIAGITINGDRLETKEYQFVEVDNENEVPRMPTDGWIDLGDPDVTIVESNTFEAYPDLIKDKQGYLSVKHYDYSGDHSTREITFGNPTNDGVVHQKAEIDSHNYYNDEDGTPVFFGDSMISSTGGANKAMKVWGYFVPKETGRYKLGAFSDDGAYGYIIIDGDKKEFVEDWRIAPPENRSNDVEFDLEAGKVYPIYMEWYEGQPVRKAFVPIYKINNSNWINIPKDCFYPSSDNTPGLVNTAYFEKSTLDNQVQFPNKTGIYYIAINTTNKKGTSESEREILYGPFIYDKTSPKNASIIINNGDQYTRDNDVKLALEATDAVEMIISENSDFSGANWEDYTSIKSFTLSTGDGIKTVYVKYRDEAGNETGVVNDSIYLDTTAPSGYSAEIDQEVINRSNEKELSFTFGDAEVGAIYNFIITSDGGTAEVTGSGRITDSNQQISGIDVSGLEDGVLTLKVTLTDEAGNTGEEVTDTVNKDLQIIITIDEPIMTDNIIQIDERDKVEISGTGDIGIKVKVNIKDKIGNYIETPETTIGEDGKYKFSGIDITSLEIGVLDITAIATDLSGNQETVTKKVNILIDISLLNISRTDENDNVKLAPFKDLSGNYSGELKIVSRFKIDQGVDELVLNFTENPNIKLEYLNLKKLNEEGNQYDDEFSYVNDRAGDGTNNSIHIGSQSQKLQSGTYDCFLTVEMWGIPQEKINNDEDVIDYILQLDEVILDDKYNYPQINKVIDIIIVELPNLL